MRPNRPGFGCSLLSTLFQKMAVPSNLINHSFIKMINRRPFTDRFSHGHPHSIYLLKRAFFPHYRFTKIAILSTRPIPQWFPQHTYGWGSHPHREPSPKKTSRIFHKTDRDRSPSRSDGNHMQRHPSSQIPTGFVQLPGFVRMVPHTRHTHWETGRSAYENHWQSFHTPPQSAAGYHKPDITEGSFSDSVWIPRCFYRIPLLGYPILYGTNSLRTMPIQEHHTILGWIEIAPYHHRRILLNIIINDEHCIQKGTSKWMSLFW